MMPPPETTEERQEKIRRRSSTTFHYHEMFTSLHPASSSSKNDFRMDTLVSRYTCDDDGPSLNLTPLLLEEHLYFDVSCSHLNLFYKTRMGRNEGTNSLK